MMILSYLGKSWEHDGDDKTQPAKNRTSKLSCNLGNGHLFRNLQIWGGGLANFCHVWENRREPEPQITQRFKFKVQRFQTCSAMDVEHHDMADMEIIKKGSIAVRVWGRHWNSIGPCGACQKPLKLALGMKWMIRNDTVYPNELASNIIKLWTESEAERKVPCLQKLQWKTGVCYLTLGETLAEFEVAEFKENQTRKWSRSLQHWASWDSHRGCSPKMVAKSRTMRCSGQIQWSSGFWWTAIGFAAIRSWRWTDMDRWFLPLGTM